MTAITVRAPSGHKAMEEILQRLGPDALILSTRHVDGKIEITALPPDGFVAPEVEEGPSEEELFAEALRTRAPLFAAPPARPFAKPAPRPPSAAAAPREAAFTARPIAPAAAAVAPKPAAPAAAEPKAPAPRPAAPATAPAPVAAPARPAAARAEAQDFAEALRQETRRPAPSVDPLDQLARQLFRPEALADEPVARIILAGPSGAGKSMLAARLAARLMLEEPGLRPQIIAPVPAAMLVEDRLRGWCRLMGLMPDRPTLAVAMNLPDPAPNAPQIIDLSDIPDAAPELAARLIDVDDAELVLCLPAGLHPARVARICHDWQAYAPTVTLTGLDHWWPERDELEAIAQAGLKLTRIASGTGLLDALSRPGVTDLRNWATGWAPAWREAAE